MSRNGEMNEDADAGVGGRGGGVGIRQWHDGTHQGLI